MINEKNKKRKRLKKKTIEIAIKGIPSGFALISITLATIFSNYIPFIKNLDNVLKSVVITSFSVVIGLLVFFILKLISSYFKKKRTNKGLQAKWMKGERIINTNKSISELKENLKDSQEKIRREIEHQENIKKTLNTFAKVSKYESDVEAVDL